MEWTLTETGTAEPGAVLSLAPKAPVQNQVSRTRGTHEQSNGFGYELGYEVKGDFVNLALNQVVACVTGSPLSTNNHSPMSADI